jgi:ketosteroid isomerase-like protein
MKHAHSSVVLSLRALAIAAAMTFSVAHADEYSDVTQLMQSGKLADALTKADQYLITKPRDPQMRFIKGVILRDSGKTPEAIATFTKLTEDYPELPEPYNNLAVLYAGQSQFDKARTALEMAIRTNPSYATAHENLGDVYAKLASQAYNKALQLDGSNQAVPPKLALIRELFTPGAGKSARTTGSAATPPTMTAQAPAATSAANKTPPVLPAVPPLTKPAATPAPSVATAPVNTTPPATKPAATAAATATAAVATPAATPTPVATPTNSANATKEVESAVQAWASAWAAKDVKSYLAAYGKSFDPPGSMKRSDWEDERRQRINGKSKISVKLESLNVSVDGNKAVAKFRQDYKADGLAVSSRKTLDLMKAGERWYIVRESTGS